MVSRSLITIALPAYNAEKTIHAAINSIVSQTYENWELILIDDGSTDSTVEIASKFKDSRIVIISDGQNKGISTRLNQAVNMAKGMYFCRMDADDISFSNRLERQVEFLEENSRVDVVASSIVIFSNDGSLNGVVEVQASHEAICKHPWRGFYFPHPTWMGKTEWFKRHGYNPLANGAEDQLLLYSTFRNSYFAGITDVLLGYREDSRNFKKMLQRRKVFWREISVNAIRNGHLIDFCILFVVQPLKVMADFLNIKFGFNGARNRMVKINPLLEKNWHILWSNSNKAIDNDKCQNPNLD